MAIIYFDSSALVKLLVDEEGSDLATTLWNSCDAALSSRLAYPEVCAALVAMGRNQNLTEAEGAEAAKEWESFWAFIRPVELTHQVQDQAGHLAGVHHLRGADAVHLASAVSLRTPNLIFAAWDRRLHAGAVSAGLGVAPASLS